MGTCAPSRIDCSKLTEEDYEYLLNSTKLDRNTIQEWHKKFMTDWPNGKLTRTGFKVVLNRLNKNGDASRFIDHVFRAFDEDNNGYIDVIEYIIGNYLSSNISTLDEKLSFAFKLYDIDRDGRIELDEIVKLIESLYDLRGVRKDSLPIDRQPENVAREIMRRFDQNGDFFITENEFIQGCKDNANIGRIILSTFN